MENGQTQHGAARDAHSGIWELLGILRKSWWLLLLVVLGCAFGAAFYSMGRTKIYRATTTIQIDPDPPKPLGQDVQSVVDVGAGIANNREYYRTQYDVLESRTLALSTVRRLALHRDPTFLLNVPSDTVIDRPLPEEAMTESAARAALASRLKINPIRDSRLVEVAFDDADTERGKRVLRTLVEIYIDHNVDSVLASTNIAAEWLDEQLQKLKSELGSNEFALHDYKRTNQILSVSLDDQSNMLREEMQQLNRALTAVRAELEALEARFEQLAQVDVTEPTELPVQELLQSAVLGGLRSQYIAARQESQALSRSGKGDKHPEVLAANSRIEISREALLAEMKNIREALRRDVEAKRKEAKGLDGLFARAKSRAMDVNGLGLEYRRLERAKVNTEKVYSMVLERSKESDLTRYMRFNNIRVIDEAFAAPAPVEPRTSFNVAVGGAFGLFLGLIAAFARNALDRTFKGVKDVEEQLQLPLLGVLPRTSSSGVSSASRRRRAPRGDELVVHEKPNSNAAEAARALRTNLMFTAPDNPQKTLVVTSAGPFEGKTTVACWVATAMAQAGKRVLLLDCDLRRPRLHKIFKRPNDTGVSALVMKEQTLSQINRTTEVPNLDVITAGPSVPNPAELLQSERFGQFLAEVSEAYDRIVIDSPPVNAVTDAAILSTRADGTVLVVRANATNRDAARHGTRLLTDVTDRLLGVILNAYDEDRSGYGYNGYRYQYYYGRQDDTQDRA